MFYLAGVMMFLSIVDFGGSPVDLSNNFASFPAALTAWAVCLSLLRGQHVQHVGLHVGIMLAACAAHVHMEAWVCFH